MLRKNILYSKEKTHNNIKDLYNRYLFEGLVKIGASVTFLILLSILAYILLRGLPHLNRDLFKLNYNTDNLSALPAIITTIYVNIISLSISLPLGIFTAFYLVEYARQDKKIISLIRLAVESLAGIPSIVYGLFGMLFFVNKLGWGFSILSGSLTLSIMILPLIIRSTEEALLSVDPSLREASLALGAGKSRTIFKVVLPLAIPGILSGLILSIGRIVGETAALTYTAGTVAQIPSSFFDSARTLSVHMYALSSEGFHMDQANATGLILIFIVFFLNTISNCIANKFKGE